LPERDARSGGGPRTIPRLFRAAVDDVADRVWLLAGDVELTYAQSLDRIERGATWLRAAGVTRGDRVVVVARNTADHLLLWFALMEVGAVQVPVNPESTPAEMAGILGQVDPVLVIDDDTVETYRDTSPDGAGPVDVDEGDVAVMFPTSGTTGRSKLVMQTHRAYVMAGEGFPWWMGLDADDRLMTSLPLFHVNAPAYSTLGSVAARASLVLLPGFSASRFLDAARTSGATEFNAIGAMLEILMRQPERADDADTRLRLCYTGPSPTRERQEAMERRFGLEIVCGYALSESPYGLIWRRGTRPFGTLGSPRQHPELGHVNDARVVESTPDDGVPAPESPRPVASGEVGELELRNPCVMLGYYGMPDETDAVLRDGWLRTGDLVVDEGDGTYTFVGRKKEVIRRRGENLAPAEVEAALARHPAVVDAAVIAVPSDLSEDDVKAFVVAAPGMRVDVEELRVFVAEHLADFKVPRYVEVLDALPFTPTGRVAKHRLPTGRTPGEVDFEPR
jgi:crotonobetaine/carnitine-CoA ligase